MKIIIILIMVLFTLQSFSGEKAIGGSIQEVLMRNNVSLDQLQKAGTLMSEGEFTGAGKRIPLKSVRVFITQDDVILGQDVSLFVQKNQNFSQATLSDLTAFHWQGMLIEMSQVKAVVVGK